MIIFVKRHSDNPILTPNISNQWESLATFNGSVAQNQGNYHLVYRAVSKPFPYSGITMNLSTIGYATSKDGIHFSDKKQLIKPENQWERYGCEDPRITQLGDAYYIFYTALSHYPFSPEGIKVAVGKTYDFNTIEKHPVTTFNSKAMALFPEKIHGRITALLTAHTDKPPAKIGIAQFNDEADMWSSDYWQQWYTSLDGHTLPLQRSVNDHIEVGAAPLKTDVGWLVIYCYIRNYVSPYRIFGIEAVVLDLEDPYKIIGKIISPLLMPEAPYELYGNVPNTIFPSGAIIENNVLTIYYGAADTTLCMATVPLVDLLKESLLYTYTQPKTSRKIIIVPKRYEDNPILIPRKDHPWEAKGTLNAAAIYEGGKVHLLYRAIGNNKVSTLGYATSSDGYRIEERFEEAVYIPRESFEVSGCEDPRITKIGDRLYMCYTAYNASHPTRVALTSILVDDFLHRSWKWEEPIIISPPGFDDKDACLFPEKVEGKYAFLHRIDPCIWIDFVDNLDFSKKRFLRGNFYLEPRTDSWDSEKIGIGPPPIKTSKGWLLIYHGLSRFDKKYRLGAVLLDLESPDTIISRLDSPILEPEAVYERNGARSDTVFSNGCVTIGNQLFIYYGAADETTCVATVDIDTIVDALTIV